MFTTTAKKYTLQFGFINVSVFVWMPYVCLFVHVVLPLRVVLVISYNERHVGVGDHEFKLGWVYIFDYLSSPERYISLMLPLIWLHNSLLKLRKFHLKLTISQILLSNYISCLCKDNTKGFLNSLGSHWTIGTDWKWCDNTFIMAIILCRLIDICPTFCPISQGGYEPISYFTNNR